VNISRVLYTRDIVHLFIWFYSNQRSVGNDSTAIMISINPYTGSKEKREARLPFSQQISEVSSGFYREFLKSSLPS
jgi:hypothetical protein